MLRDYLIQMSSQGAEYFMQQSVGGGFPRRHKFVREAFKKLKWTMIWKLAGSRAEWYQITDSWLEITGNLHACELLYLVQVYSSAVVN